MIYFNLNRLNSSPSNEREFLHQTTQGEEMFGKNSTESSQCYAKQFLNRAQFIIPNKIIFPAPRE